MAKQQQQTLPARAAYVQWLDACTQAGTQSTKDAIRAAAPARQHAIGWLLKDDESGVLLAEEINIDSDDCRDTRFIPRAMVVSVVDLGAL